MIEPELFLKWIEEHPGLASWVQAIGSIAAICATAVIATLGTREARRAAWRQERDTLDKIETLIQLEFPRQSEVHLPTPIHWAWSVLAGRRFKIEAEAKRYCLDMGKRVARFRARYLTNIVFPTAAQADHFREYFGEFENLCNDARLATLPASLRVGQKWEFIYCKMQGKNRIEVFESTADWRGDGVELVDPDPIFFANSIHETVREMKEINRWTRTELS